MALASCALASALLAPACSSGGDSTSNDTTNPNGDGGVGTGTNNNNSNSGTDAGTSHPGSDGSTTPKGDGSVPSGWLRTVGNKIVVQDGSASGTPWIGRGVNVDDIFLCGYNNTLQTPGADQKLEQVLSGLITTWKPNFIRISLSMASYTSSVDWMKDTASYTTPMINVVKSIGQTPGVYVLVTLRSDGSMIDQTNAGGDAEATGVPSDSTTTPDKNKYPNGTDPVYQALVDAFADDSFVMFGITNEPGGNTVKPAVLSAAMDHAVGVIRAEEDKLGKPHHLVSVQGNNWTSDISFYSATPLKHDNVVYEVHGYPPTPSMYTFANIPVIIGEYGTLGNSASFFADIESKQISSLAWDFEPYSDCTPDLLNVNHSSSTLSPTAWGTTVQTYLLQHAP